MILKHLEYLEQVYKDKLKINYKDDFTGTTSYLYKLIDYSVTYKDIKSFFLFLYLHDTNECLHLKENEDNYKSWILSITYLFAYEIDIFTNKDVEHNSENTKSYVDKKIEKYLLDNLIYKEGDTKISNFFLKQNSWEGLKICSLKTRIKCISKLLSLYNHVKYIS